MGIVSRHGQPKSKMRAVPRTIGLGIYRERAALRLRVDRVVHNMICINKGWTAIEVAREYLGASSLGACLS
jgi:hypothetical protein